MSWGALIPSFAAHYRTYHVEHRGHGRTDNPAGRLSYAQLADDAAAFIERLALAPAHLAGISDGATVGLVLGMRRPELLRSLVCVGANYRLDAQLTREMQRIFDPEAMERDAPGWVAALVAAHDAHQYPGYWRELVGHIRANVDEELAYTEAELRRIPVPTLLIAGETDRYVSLEQMLEMRRGIPHAEMLILNHAGMDPSANHVVQHTRAEVVGPVILEFLSRQARANGTS